MATPPKKTFIKENMNEILNTKIKNSSLNDKLVSEQKINSQKETLYSEPVQENTGNTNLDSSIKKNKKKKKKKKKKTRCYHCNIKLKIVNFGCKCQTEFRFCTKCKMPEYHNCPVNWKQVYRDNLNKTLPKIEFNKLESI